MPKALRSLTLDQTMATRLGIGSWHYRATDDRLIISGCLAMHLLGVDQVELPLASLLSNLSSNSSDTLAAALRQDEPIDCLTFKCCGYNAEDGLFRLFWNDRAGGLVQRLTTETSIESGAISHRQRLCQDLETRLEKSAAGGQTSTVLLLVKIKQLALLEPRKNTPSLAETVVERLERLPNAQASYRLENDIIALVLGTDPHGRPNRPREGRLRASECVRRAQLALKAPASLAGRDYVLTTTIGAAACPRHAVTAETLYQRAAVALAYAQKQHRHGRHAVFSRQIAAELADRLTLENDLRQALAKHELELRYQPIVALDHRRLNGLEVLMRWQHPTRGFVPPDIFIPLAEQLGLIQPFTEWLIGTAAVELQAFLNAAPEIRININLSARQATPELVRVLLRHLTEGAALNATRVTFEVTEGALLENVALALEALSELKAKGCRIALDDFGTGFSSISYLETFPIDIIKIDKGFIRRISKSTESRKLVEAMLFMANALELDCVAEGVEDIEELAFLAAKGCRHIQGFLFAKPLTAKELPEFLKNFRFPEEALAAALWPKAKGLPRLLSDNQEEALKLFVKHVPLAVAMFDSDMRYLAASDRWIRDYDIEDEAIVGRCHYEVLPETPQKWREGHARVLATGAVERSEVDSYRNASGRLDWLRWEVRPFHNSFGDVAGIIIFSEFITDRVEAETQRRDSEEKLADYLATASDWFWETDTDHRLMYDSLADAATGDAGDRAPLGRTHWEIAGIRKPAEHEAWRAHLLDLEARRPFRDFRYSETTPAGRVSHVEISGKPVFDAKGQFKGYRGTGRTITARVEAEQAQRRQAEQLAFAGRLARVGYWRTDLKRQTVDWSPEIYDIIGRTPDDFTPDISNRFDIFHAADRRRVMTAILKAAESGSELHYEARVQRSDGSLRYVVCQGRPEFEKSSRLKGFFGIFQDITEHRQAAVAAEHQAAQLALASEIAGIAYWMHDCTTGSTFRSPEIERITGHSAADTPHGTIFHLAELHPDDRAAHTAAWQAALTAGTDLEDRCRLIRPDGTVRHALIKARNRRDDVGLLTGFFGIVHDVTEQVETAATIAARNRENELYRAMIDILPDFIFAKDKDGRFLAANAATAKLMGAGRPSDLIGKTDYNFYEPAIADRFHADEQAFIAAGRTVILEQPGVRLNGEAGFLCSLKAPMHDAQGKLRGYVGHGRDITDERRAQAALIESEAHFRQLVDGSLQALAIEQDGAVVFANDRLARLLGYTHTARAIADAANRLAAQPRATRQILARLGKRLNRGETIESAHRLEVMRLDGTPITVDSLACSIVWRGRPALQHTMIDITRQVRYEATIEAEKKRLTTQADEMTRLAAALARSKLEAEAARDMLNDATAVLSDGFALFDADSCIVSCNPAFAALYGCTADELIGTSIHVCVERLIRSNVLTSNGMPTSKVIKTRLEAHRQANGTPFEVQLGNRWFVIRENRTAKGMTALLRSEITHLKKIQGELERLATIDVLTDLANRRHFIDQATRLLTCCRNDAAPAALLIFDIDHFKLINDRYGHATGDRALRHLAALCRKQLRPADLIARWGGEEFVVLLPRLALDHAVLVADRLRRTVASTMIHTGEADVGFTISMGVVACGPNEPLEALINRADGALYDAKLQGRDRVLVDPTSLGITACHMTSPIITMASANSGKRTARSTLPPHR